MLKEQLLLFAKNTFVSAYGLIFMLAGILFFRMYKGDLFDYYIKKGWKLIAPFFFLSWITLASKIGFSISLTYAKDVLKGFFLRTICEDYWIFYSLFGFYLVAPFLKKMLEALGENEKRCMLYVLVGYFAFFTGGVLLDYKIMLYGYPFLNWITYALGGYLVLHIAWKPVEIKRIYILGAIAFLVSTVEALCFPGVNWSLDSYCLSRILICLAVFLWAGKARCANG